MSETPGSPAPRKARRKYHPTVGPRLSRWLAVTFALFSILSVNSAYLGSITFLQFRTGEVYENTFYLGMFLLHLVLGFIMIVPVVVFGSIHLVKARTRPNRRAVKVGYALFAMSLLLLLTGVLLTRIEGILEIRDGGTRRLIYWAHVAAPFVAAWLFVLHRLAGRKIRWRTGATWAGVGAVFTIGMVLLHSQDPRAWNRVGPESGEQYFFPSLARTVTGDFIPAESLMQDEFCEKCHPQAHEGWKYSSHRFASFNNPIYLFSVKETRKVAFERDGDVQAARFCAGCHDPVPFFSGAFDDPNFDDQNDPTAHAGVTCTVCHAITNINSNRGNSDYTIDEPARYPFARSESKAGQWLREQLIKAKPALHKRTYLKPFHAEADFCGVCHKVHLPEELNHYKWLRGQNHYDTHRLSGVSGHGITSFYYPPKAIPDCNSGGCHMHLLPSDEFAAKDFAGDGTRTVHDHSFPSANTAIPHLFDFPPEVNARHRALTEGSLRLDLFGLRRGATIDSPLEAPIRPEVPSLSRGETVLLELVVRTLTLGHAFTQGTVDSNEIWVELDVTSGGRSIGRSGGRANDGAVDPWSHFVNAYILDRHGNRIDRRNAQDIFVALYNNQIPPGAADVVRYRLQVPEDVGETITVTARLLYRKFDTTLMQYVYGPEYTNDLPIMEIARDTVTFSVGGEVAASAAPDIAPWQRWNDYGIGLLRKGGSGAVRGELPSAIAAFDQVAALGRPDGVVNRARAELQAGRIDATAASLERAATWDPPPPPWTLAWFTSRVNQQNGHYEDALASLTSIVETAWPDARARGFDFSRDDRVWNEIGAVRFAMARRLRGEAAAAEREAHLLAAIEAYEESLALDSESVPAHYGLAQVYAALGDGEREQEHRALHAKYKIDDHARDHAFSVHRAANPAADHAAEAIVIYDLHRPGAPPIPR